MQGLMGLFFLGITLGAYLVGRYISLKYNHPLLNVILLSVSIVIATLLILKIPYSQYASATNLIKLLLGPATVALAVPLYRNRQILRRHFSAILAGVLFGSSVSMIATGFIAFTGSLSRELFVSLIPRSVTLPFAIDISNIYGGNPALTISFTVATGLLGAILGPALLFRSKVTDPVSRGLALGTVSHGLGIAAALLEGDEAGAMAGIAMVLAGIMTTLLAPFFIPLFTG